MLNPNKSFILKLNSQNNFTINSIFSSQLFLSSFEESNFSYCNLDMAACALILNKLSDVWLAKNIKIFDNVIIIWSQDKMLLSNELLKNTPRMHN